MDTPAGNEPADMADMTDLIFSPDSCLAGAATAGPDLAEVFPAPEPDRALVETTGPAIVVEQRPDGKRALPDAPAGYPVDWPLFKAAPGFSEDFSDFDIPHEIAEVLTSEQAMGMHRIYFQGDNGPELFYVREPKFKALVELMEMVAAFEALDEAARQSPTGMRQAVAMVVPLLRRPDPVTGKRRKVDLDEGMEYIGIPEVNIVLKKAFPNAEQTIPSPRSMLLTAGHDPKP